MKFLCKVFACAALAFVVRACEEECAANPGTCVCASTTSPLPVEQTPQFVTITFDDAVTSLLESLYIDEIFNGRVNPDNTSATCTFYVPHPYTNYEVVNRLCNKGHEIGLNSVSKGNVDYWRNLDANQTGQEFTSGRIIAETNGNVPFTEPYGARIPNLQVEGDATFGGYSQAGVHHDSSCVVSYSNKLFPFNLDYPTTQTCFIGSLPTQSYPGKWVLPIIALRRRDGYLCKTLAECQTDGTDEEIAEWLKEQFLECYLGNRAPMTLMASKMWFELHENNLPALQLFLDYLGTLPDVYVVSHREVLRFSENPTPLPYTTNFVADACGTCDAPNDCSYTVASASRRMETCVACPDVYPDLDNPTGSTPS